MHGDFTYIPEAPPVTLTTTLGAKGGLIPAEADAKFYALRIERWHPIEAWSALIPEIPAAFRNEAAAYLADRYKIIKEARRIAEHGKKSDAGNAEIEKLREFVKKL